MISIIIPTYNRPKMLQRILDSIGKQTLKDFEVIVVDDASSTFAENKIVCQKYKFTNYILNTDNKGAPHCRNIGIKQAKYDLICLCDDDDEWFTKKLEKQLSLMQESDFGLIYTWANIVDASGEKIETMNPQVSGNVSKELLQGNFIPSSSVMIRKECFEQVGYFDEKFVSCQDWEMWLRISLDFKIGALKEYLISYYKHEEGSVGLSKNSSKGYIQFSKKFIKNYYKEGLIVHGIKLYLYGTKQLLRGYFGK